MSKGSKPDNAPEKTQEYWEAKHPPVVQMYDGRPLPNGKPCRLDVRNFIMYRDAVVKNIVKNYDIKKDSIDDTVLAAQQFVVKNFKYVSDETIGRPEYWLFPFESLAMRQGDCFAGYEEVYTASGVKRIADVEVGDLLLSYDFAAKKYVHKRVSAHWAKGKLQVNRVQLRNGQHFDVSEDHPMWARVSQKGSVYKKVKLSEVDLSKWWRRKIPVAKQIPYEVVSAPYEKDLYTVMGHFVAEGWVEKAHVASSGYELLEYIIPILDEYNIPYTEYTNNSGVPCVRFLESPIKDALKTLKTSSFDIQLPEWVLRAPSEYLEAFLYGMWLGDGTKSQYPDARGYANNKAWTYSTSSKKLAEDIQRIGLHLGRPVHIWRQEDHQGVGSKPIYRINYNTNSHFVKDFGYPGISEVSIRHVEKLGAVDMYDMTVEDTHTVVLKNGAILHQCEDGAILIASLILAAIPKAEHWRVRVSAGWVQARPTAPQGGHAYVTYCRPQDNEWVVVDWCYLEDAKVHVRDKPVARKNAPYKDVWFSFNYDQAYSHINFELSGRLKEVSDVEVS